MTSAVPSGGQSEIPEGWRNLEESRLSPEKTKKTMWKTYEKQWRVKKIIYKLLIYVDVPMIPMDWFRGNLWLKLTVFQICEHTQTAMRLFIFSELSFAKIG